MPKEVEKAIREMPRDAEVIELLEKSPRRASCVIGAMAGYYQQKI
jgi:hypothetical protein